VADGFSGIDELIADMQKLPDDMKGEAGNLILGSANAMATDVRREYPFKKGALVRGVTVNRRGPLLVQVRSSSPEAHLNEFGTVQRSTAAGANRGSMPAKPVFIPAAVRHRRRLFEGFQQMLRRIRVRGMTGSAA
jgi:HK97 gp10 family phage protein